ncbi:hypothetical protein QBC47DRAFT_404905 [Echria macrotheca]|uniref:Heterokaryon incompatibility domain-containing protein n=1 Tax=Echria macrotheca TaxID=438768 RepID=A0AAJ0B891_9PEZI|nr:hypothetical protein QBC47DRAFT_404905 [Echria macrotheca]
MSSIYQHAHQVIAWVGDDQDDAGKVLQFLDNHCDKLSGVSSYEERKDTMEKNAAAVSFIGNAIKEAFPGAGLEPFRKFFRRSWFGRRWIIQEIVLAEKPVIRCGSVSMRFSRFAVGASIMNLFFEAQTMSHPLDPVFLMQDHMAQMLSSIANSQRLNAWKGMVLAEYRFPILQLLREFQSAKCSDDRDKVYALIALSDDVVAKPEDAHETARLKRQRREKPELSVNYSHKADQVYISLAAKIVDKKYFYNYRLYELFGTASAFRPSHSSSTSDSIPSWVPDWRITQRFEPVIEPEYKLSIEGCQRCCWELSEDEKTMSITGWNYATVSERTGHITDLITEFQHIKATIQEWWKQYTADHGGRPVPPTSIHDESWYHGFFDLVVMGRTTWDGGMVHPPRDFVGLLLEGVVPDEWTDGKPTIIHPVEEVTDNLLRMRRYTKQLVSMLQGRGLFRSEKGQLMNCPDDTEVGDVIVIFGGIDIPYVIRLIMGGDNKPGRYRLIGDAYVDGVMDSPFDVDPDSQPKITEEELGEALEFLLE